MQQYGTMKELPTTMEETLCRNISILFLHLLIVMVGTAEHKLFIGMLPKGASKADVMAVFSEYGTIKELSVIKGSQPTSRGMLNPWTFNTSSLLQFSYLNGPSW